MFVTSFLCFLIAISVNGFTIGKGVLKELLVNKNTEYCHPFIQFNKGFSNKSEIQENDNENFKSDYSYQNSDIKLRMLPSADSPENVTPLSRMGTLGAVTISAESNLIDLEIPGLLSKRNKVQISESMMDELAKMSGEGKNGDTHYCLPTIPQEFKVKAIIEGQGADFLQNILQDTGLHPVTCKSVQQVFIGVPGMTPKQILELEIPAKPKEKIKGENKNSLLCDLFKP